MNGPFAARRCIRGAKGEATRCRRVIITSVSGSAGNLFPLPLLAPGRSGPDPPQMFAGTLRRGVEVGQPPRYYGPYYWPAAIKGTSNNFIVKGQQNKKSVLLHDTVFVIQNNLTIRKRTVRAS